MTNSLHDLINSHRSIRKYKDLPLDREVLDRLAALAMRAATSYNTQCYSIVITTDRNLREQLYQAHLQQDMIRQASAVVTFCADVRDMHQWFVASGAPAQFDDLLSWMRAVVDAALLAQNFVTAAEAIGLGTCYMGSTLMNPEKIIDILNLPKLVFPVTSIVIGHKDEEPASRPRFPVHSRLHYETYDQQDKFSQTYAGRENQSFTRLAQNNPQVLESISQGLIQNTAQLYAATKYRQEDLQEYATKLRALIQAQGFNITEEAMLQK